MALTIEVDNGGLEQFFLNSVGQYAPETVAALERIGSDETAGLLRKAITLFPSGIVPADIDTRNNALTDLDDSADEMFDALNDSYFSIGSEGVLGRLAIYFLGGAA